MDLDDFDFDDIDDIDIENSGDFVCPLWWSRVVQK
jgi:serine/threonine-protein kinase SRK2